MSLLGRICSSLLIYALPALLVVSPALFATELDTLSRENLRPGVTEISRSIYDLHNFVIYICVGMAVVVYGLLIFSIYKYRKSKGAEAATFSHSMKAEIVWTLIPVILLVIMGIPAVNVLARMYDSSDSEIDVLVTGYQWSWSYEYLDEDFRFFSNMVSDSDQYTVLDQIENKAPKDVNYLLNVDNPAVIPVNTKVRFLVTAQDVIHSWWVPDFAIKRDAIPGYVNEASVIVEKEGTYRGQCAELCGKDHAYMPIVVEVVSQEEYQNWIAAQKEKAQGDDLQFADSSAWYTDAWLERGAGVYTTNCVACHQVNGGGVPPVFPSLIGAEKVVGDSAVTLDVILNGVQGTAMQGFGLRLNDADISAVISYIRSSWGNAPEQKVVTPPEVAAAR